ncbi:MAG: glycosyltransferase [Leeuwenhoekiella sp.]
MPKFSVIIPVYNKANFISETLQSVLNQNYRDFEIIAVNDGSTDNSLEILKGFKVENLRIINQENSGLSNARNTGINEAKGTLIALLDGDDLWLPDHLKNLSFLAKNWPEASIFGTAYTELFPKGNTVNPKISVALPQPGVIADFFEANFNQPLITPSSFSFKKEVVDDIGGFDPKITYSEDVDFFIRANLKFKLAYYPKVSCLYRVDSENQITHSRISNLQPPDFKFYLQQNPTHASLKKYINLKYYYLCNFYKTEGRLDLFKLIKAEICVDLLNWKQRLLLAAPRIILLKIRALKTKFLLKGRRYTTF